MNDAMNGLIAIKTLFFNLVFHRCIVFDKYSWSLFELFLNGMKHRFCLPPDEHRLGRTDDTGKTQGRDDYDTHSFSLMILPRFVYNAGKGAPALYSIVQIDLAVIAIDHC